MARFYYVMSPVKFEIYTLVSGILLLELLQEGLMTNPPEAWLRSMKVFVIDIDEIESEFRM